MIWIDIGIEAFFCALVMLGTFFLIVITEHLMERFRK